MDIGSILLGLALTIGVGFIVLQPLLEGGWGSEAGPSEGEALLAEREAVLGALRELDFDHATGKITPEDHETQRAALVAQGAALLRRLDELGVRPGSSGADDAIEAAIAARRRPAGAQAPAVSTADAFCGQCGAPARTGDLFCARCGAALSRPA